MEQLQRTQHPTTLSSQKRRKRVSKKKRPDCFRGLLDFVDYRDKYDLAEQINDLLLLEVNLPAPSELLDNPIAQTVGLFEHFAQYQEVYRVMLSPQGIPGFADLVRNHVGQHLQTLFSFLGVCEQKTGVPQAGLVRYLATAQVGFVHWWLDEGMPLTPTEAAECLLALHGYGGRVHAAMWDNDGESLHDL